SPPSSAGPQIVVEAPTASQAPKFEDSGPWTDLKGWQTKDGATVESIVDADKGAVEKLTETVSDGRHRVESIARVGTKGTVYIIEPPASPAGRTTAYIEPREISNPHSATAAFDLSTGATRISDERISIVGSMKLADGWIRIWSGMAYDDDIVFNL